MQSNTKYNDNEICIIYSIVSFKSAYKGYGNCNEKYVSNFVDFVSFITFRKRYFHDLTSVPAFVFKITLNGCLDTSECMLIFNLE